MADPRFPVANFTIPRTGHFGDVRSSPRDGWCPRGEYPCTHHGVDLDAPSHTPVVAPHDGWVLAAMMAPKGQQLPPPFTGYEPGVVLIAHDDVDAPSLLERFAHAVTWEKTPQAARYSLLGHVVTQYDIPLHGYVYKDDDKRYWKKLDDGTVVMLFEPGDGRAEIESSRTPKNRYVQAGDVVGYISPDVGHVHWEIRPSPLAGPSERIDPLAFFQEVYHLGTPRQEGFPWMLALLLAGAYFASE